MTGSPGVQLLPSGTPFASTSSTLVTVKSPAVQFWVGQVSGDPVVWAKVKLENNEIVVQSISVKTFLLMLLTTWCKVLSSIDEQVKVIHTNALEKRALLQRMEWIWHKRALSQAWLGMQTPDVFVISQRVPPERDMTVLIGMEISNNDFRGVTEIFSVNIMQGT